MSRQQIADTIQAAIYAAMFYFAAQDTQMNHPAWLLGLVPIVVIFSFENDHWPLKVAEGVMTILIPLCYIILPKWGLSGRDEAGDLIIILFLWNGADLIHYVAERWLDIKGHVHHTINSNAGGHPAKAAAAPPPTVGAKASAPGAKDHPVPEH